MSMKEKDHNTGDNLQTIEETLGRTERYIEENRKSLMIIIAAIIVIVGGYMGYRKFFQQPKELEAQQQMFTAERYFEKDSFKLALKGDGSYPGLLDIIDEYGSTKSGKLAYYYTGVCYLRNGDYDNAIKYLKDYSGGDKIIASMAIGALGDAYLEKGDKKEALDYYLKAAKQNENDFTTPYFLMKVGMVYEITGEKQKALETYQVVKDKFYKSTEGRKAEKYIAKLEAQM